jgi:hypothetical protein
MLKSIGHNYYDSWPGSLERDALVTGTQYRMIPPRVDYELTQLGRSLGDAVEPLGPWAQGHVKHIIRARAAFDKKIYANPWLLLLSEQPAESCLYHRETTRDLILLSEKIRHHVFI